MLATGFPRLVPVAERAVLAEFGEVVSEEVHQAVLALDRALSDRPVAGQAEVVPGMVNLLVIFDPLVTDHGAVAAALRDRISAVPERQEPGRLHEIAICYEGAFGPDLQEVADQTGLEVEAVIAAHLSGDYRVFMYGFAPGYAYLSGLPEAPATQARAGAGCACGQRDHRGGGNAL
ncbi:MAG: carboxyltransferase domain-containing protein [Paracoccaceae bacterium]